MILIPKHRDTVELGGSLSLVLTDTITNTVRKEIFMPNLVVTAGKVWIRDRMYTTPATMGYMGIGTNGVAGDAAGDIALGFEWNASTSPTAATVTYTRAATTATASGTSGIQYVATFLANNPNIAVVGQTGGAILREAAIFNAATGPTMLCKTTFPTVTKAPADAVTITWIITIN